MYFELRYLIKSEPAENESQAEHLAAGGPLVDPRGGKVHVVALHRYEALEWKVNLTRVGGCDIVAGFGMGLGGVLMWCDATRCTASPKDNEHKLTIALEEMERICREVNIKKDNSVTKDNDNDYFQQTRRS